MLLLFPVRSGILLLLLNADPLEGGLGAHLSMKSKFCGCCIFSCLSCSIREVEADSQVFLAQ